jgi:phosphocarrier protein
MALFSTKKTTPAGTAGRVSKQLTVLNQLGVHARPAALFVKVANKFESDITVEKDGEQVNGKSIMGLMMLAAACGSKLTVIAEGRDAETAVRELEQLFLQKFNEQ